MSAMRLVKVVVCIENDEGVMEWHLVAAENETNLVNLKADRSGQKLTLEMVIDDKQSRFVITKGSEEKLPPGMIRARPPAKND